MLAQAKGVVMRFELHTNGFFIDKEWCDLFKLFSVKVAITLAGPKVYHDQVRALSDGRSSFRRVIRGLGFLKEEKVDYHVKVVLHPSSSVSVLMRFLVETLKLKSFECVYPDIVEAKDLENLNRYALRLSSHWLLVCLICST